MQDRDLTGNHERRSQPLATEGRERRSTAFRWSVIILVVALLALLIGVRLVQRSPSLAERREWYAARAERIIEVSEEFLASPVDVVGYSRIGDVYRTSGEWRRSDTHERISLEDALAQSGLTRAAFEKWLHTLKELRVIQIQSGGTRNDYLAELLIERSGLLTNGRSVVLVVYRQPRTQIRLMPREEVMLVVPGVFIVVRQ